MNEVVDPLEGAPAALAEAMRRRGFAELTLGSARRAGHGVGRPGPADLVADGLGQDRRDRAGPRATPLWRRSFRTPPMPGPERAHPGAHARARDAGARRAALALRGRARTRDRGRDGRDLAGTRAACPRASARDRGGYAGADARPPAGRRSRQRSDRARRPRRVGPHARHGLSRGARGDPRAAAGRAADPSRLGDLSGPGSQARRPLPARRRPTSRARGWEPRTATSSMSLTSWSDARAMPRS